MSETYDIKKSLFKIVSGNSEDHPLINKLEAHQERIAADPEIQRRRTESIAATRRSSVPVMIALLAFNFGLCYWLSSVLPELFPLPGALFGAFVLWALLMYLVYFNE